MKPTVTPLTEIYTQWLASFRAMFPGSAPSVPSIEETLPPKAAQAAAVQEWEDEGGAIKPVPVPEDKAAAKLPL